jgi:dolichol-phosphate mannosyltransferase
MWRKALDHHTDTAMGFGTDIAGARRELHPVALTIDVVIPCYRVSKQIVPVVRDVLAQAQVRNVIVVDDACPEQSGQVVQEVFAANARVVVLSHEANLGVGGAVLTGYRYAFAAGAQIVVKVDGDGQMAPRLIGTLIKPILIRQADYTKGNRFFNPKSLAVMPKIRLFGNSVLSLVNKFSSGYWSIIDPTNGFTAISSAAYRQLDLDTLDHRYFFESDLLFQLGIVNAVVKDVPMQAVYADEPSSLNISRLTLEFPPKYINRFFKRIAFKYFIREFNIASLEIICGVPALCAGLSFGLYEWMRHKQLAEFTPPGQTMIVGLLILMGFQLILSALNYDITHEPQFPLVLQETET